MTHHGRLCRGGASYSTPQNSQPPGGSCWLLNTSECLGPPVGGWVEGVPARGTHTSPTRGVLPRVEDVCVSWAGTTPTNPLRSADSSQPATVFAHWLRAADGITPAVPQPQKLTTEVQQEESKLEV